MDIKKWLKRQEFEVASELKNSNTYVADGIEYDLDMSTAFGDQWFFALLNNEWEKVVPKLCMRSVVYSIAMDTLVHLSLRDFSREELLKLLDDSIRVSNDIKGAEGSLED